MSTPKLHPRRARADLDDALQLARVLLVHAVSPIFDECGNSYANAYTEQWLRHAKSLGAYHGRAVGSIIELRQEWEDWLDKNGGLPDWPLPLRASAAKV